jgi:DNA-binding GntR family transcriptional regulator
MPNVWSKQQKLSLAAKVADEIRTAILGTKLGSGERLVEADVALKMGVSRATVRDALRHLEREGLVSVTPWRGTTVVGLSERDISEVASLRARLEAFAIELAISQLTPAACTELKECVERMVAEAKRNNLSGINEADFAFHRAIWKIADHRRLLQALDSLSVTIRALISISNLVYPAAEGIAAEHTKILKAITAGQTEQAKRLVHDHAIRFGETVLREMRLHSPAADTSDTHARTPRRAK